MTRNVVKVMMVVIAAMALGMTGCGGGSGSSTPPTTQTPSTVSTSTFSGKSFAVTGGSLTFNADGTLSGVGINVAGETWTINSSSQLVIYGSSKGTQTITISGNATNGYTGSVAYANGTTETLTLTPVAAGNVFTTAMLSGKSMTSPHGTDVDTSVFKSDGTWIMTRVNQSSPSTVIGSNSGTWSINSSGQLITTTTATTYTDTVLNTPNTITLVSSTGSNLTLLSKGSTLVFTYVDAQTAGFTNAIISGKSFTTSNGVVTFNTNGTVSGAGVNTGNETWTVNSSSQLVVYNTGKGTAIFTLISGNATLGWTASVSYTGGTASMGVLVPA